ncbi:MAG: mobile mystery protein A [Bryobacteraceae bacterium]|nr:mobile mystery protein A [Bryobacteraceae bacterium]
MPIAHRALAALDLCLLPLRSWVSSRPPHGWLRAIRDGLGMTAAQYAARLGVSQPRISALEKSEAEETVTLATLRRAAEALDCQLVYAIVPNQPLTQTLRERAQLVANKQLARTDHTMRLESQGLSPDDLVRERDRLVEELLQGNPRRLWDAL